jgi:hypothetical protein
MAVFTTWKGKHFVVDASSAPEDPWYAQLTGALFTLQVPATFVVAAFYWILVYPSNTYALKPLSVFTHGVNFVVSFLDMWLSRQPFHFSHGLLFCTYACLYSLMGLLFWMLGLRTCGEQCSVNDDESACTIAGDTTACMWTTNGTAADTTSWYCSGGNDGGDRFLYAAIDFNQGAFTWCLLGGLVFVIAPLVCSLFIVCISRLQRVQVVHLLEVLDCLSLFRLLGVLEQRLTSALRRASSFSKGALFFFFAAILGLVFVLPFASTNEWSIDGTQEVCKGRFLRGRFQHASQGTGFRVEEWEEPVRNTQHRMFPSHWWNVSSSAMSLVGFTIWLLASPHQSTAAKTLDHKRMVIFLFPPCCRPKTLQPRCP